MLIGLVGLPNAGKSTFFKACTLSDVLIASYPFATIKPNHGIGYVKIKALCGELGVKCNPRTGYCANGKRFVPVELMDVAGLVEGASKGKGLGNEFLSDLTNADALIHIVDISGETDSEGKETKGYNPINDIQMLENELDLWYLGILKKVWKTFARTMQQTKKEFAEAVATQFSGLKVKEEDVKHIVLKLGYNSEKPSEWTDDQLMRFAHELRHISKPMIVAANKIDLPSSGENLGNLKKAYPELIIVPCSSDSELALREASSHELIDYIPGEKDFKLKGELNEKQKQALESIRKNVLSKYEHGTGVQEVLNKVVFDLLNQIAIFPVGAKFGDNKGNILPDCFLVQEGITALDFAYAVHTDLGKNFIKAIDMKTKQAIGKEHKLKHKDCVEIIIR